MFLFEISSDQHPALEAETEELLRQRLEARSRRALPGMWKVTDALHTYAATGPGREKRQGRYRIYGAILLVLGVLVLVPGLAEPRTLSLILAGAIGIIAGLLELCLARKRKSASIPASCKKEAEKLLAGQRAADWSKAMTKVGFDEIGMTISSGEDQEVVPYQQISEIFESEHLWLLLYNNERALLLQRKDLILGEADLFSSHILDRIHTQG